MVEQTFVAFDNESFIIDTSSPSGTPGNPIINNSSVPVGTVFEFQGGYPVVDVTIDDTGGNPDVFEDDDEANHVIVDGAGIVADGTQVESESKHFVRELDAGGNPTGPEITITVFSQNGVTGDIWGMATDTPLTPGATYVKTGGSNLGDSVYSASVPCFVAGTMIRTPAGHLPVESIEVGDAVWTRGNDRAIVRWTGRAEADGTGDLAPIVFEAGTIGNTRTLRVSPQHRVLVETMDMELLFGEPSVLVPAKHLVGLPGVFVQPVERVVYHHFMFDQHEIVDSDGALTDTERRLL